MTPAARLLALALCAGFLGGPAQADDVSDGVENDADSVRIVERTSGILQALGQWDVEDAQARNDLIETIAELPPADRVAIVHALAALQAGGAPEAHRDLLRDVLDRLGRFAVTSALDGLAAPDATRDERALLFWYARSQDSGAGLDTVLLAAASCDDVEMASPAVQSHVRQAIHAEIQRREPEPEDLARMLKVAPSQVRILVLDALERGGSRVSTRTFSTLLGADVPSDIALLRRLVRLPVREARPFDDVMGHRLPSYLRHRDAEVRRLTALCAMRFRPNESIETVVAMLDDPDAGVRSAAHRALSARSGSRLLAERKLWEKWLSDERAHVEDARPRLEATAGGHDAADALAALRTIRAHPLFGEKGITAVVVALTHDDPTVRAEACSTLATLGDFSALTDLTRRLEDDDERVAEAASQALAQLTGVRGARTAEEWHAQLLLGR